MGKGKHSCNEIVTGGVLLSMTKPVRVYGEKQKELFHQAVKMQEKELAVLKTQRLQAQGEAMKVQPELHSLGGAKRKAASAATLLRLRRASENRMNLHERWNIAQKICSLPVRSLTFLKKKLTLFFCETLRVASAIAFAALRINKLCM